LVFRLEILAITKNKQKNKKQKKRKEKKRKNVLFEISGTAGTRQYTGGSVDTIQEQKFE